ncbi:Rhodanese Homology Domain fused to Zn-dependent hydrolase of beta-lactamase superfamily [Halalkaliarchaeum sp. AArc-CO]|uniref:MBL fold metallo-hydrolase n=1 Tax=Halalkaliarchaeum sp. AArc-CO TaxID=2866381 RepID=UPI00217DD40F|nr:rhodanese-like domain-containing protein [Halalkaliarchaeum sp. AArc-CO]UWG52108.1 Rhodanese Homology Domain fused to Zn-dependent hydrolase of beta-lactamase superfamily [Halalkaliarchaeum sp. AArc-CO]
MVETITPARLRDWIDEGRSFALLDTRPDDSYDAWHIRDAIQYTYKPDFEFDPAEFRAQTELSPDDEIVTICAKGVSSFDIAKRLEDSGYGEVTVVEGGMQGWSEVYDVVDVPTDGDVEIVQFQRRAKGCLGYLIADPAAEVAAVVDATRHVEKFAALASDRGYTIEAVLDTHVHADHLSGGRELADHVGATYYLGADASDRGVTVDYRPLERNEVVRVGDVSVKAIQTPGHTSEAVSYLVDAEAVVTGDTLFVDSVGRTELQFGEGDAAEGAKLLYDSLHWTLLAEPDSITVLPGHFAIDADGTTAVTPGEPVAATIGAVRTGVDLLAVDRETFVSRVTESVPEKPPNYETIIDVNASREPPGDEQRTVELELGPNNCAATGD